MMLEKAIIWILAGMVVGFPVYGLLSGALGLMDKVETVGWCLPMPILLAILSRTHLPLMVFFNALAVSVPLIGHRPVPIAVMFPFLVFAGFVARLALIRTSSLKNVDRFIDAVMFITSIAIVLWIGIERPKMASFGYEIGGAWEAMMALSAVAVYWGMRSLRNQSHNWKLLVSLTFAGAVAGMIWKSIEASMEYASVSNIIIACFFASGWWFYGIALAVAVKIWRSSSRLFNLWPFYIIAVLLTLHSLASGYRSRIFFAPLMIGAAFWCGHLRKAMVFFLMVFFCLTVFLANTDLGTELPGTVRRVLSPLRITEDKPDVWMEKELGEFGPESPWRRTVWKSAWYKIKQNPVLGNGFAFSGTDLYADMVYASSSGEAITRGVITSGEFHCVPINLMYYLGIPVAALFCIAWLLLFKKLIHLASKSEGWFGVFTLACLCYLIAATGHALTTGGGIDFLAVCMVMGVCQAIAPSAASASEDASGNDEEESVKNDS